MTDTTTPMLPPGVVEAVPARPPAIYAALAAIMAKVGVIAKGQPAQGGGLTYAYRKIDDIVIALHPLLIEHGVLSVPSLVEKTTDLDAKTSNGKAAIHVSVVMDHIFYAADGSHVTARTAGQSLDTGDKAAAKAQTLSWKAALLEVFSIPAGEAAEAPAEYGGRRQPKPAAAVGKAAAPPTASDTQALCRWIDALAEEAAKLGGGKKPAADIIAEAIGRFTTPDTPMDRLSAEQLLKVGRKLASWVKAKKNAAAPAPAAAPGEAGGVTGGGSVPAAAPPAPATPLPEPPADIDKDIRRLVAALAFMAGEPDPGKLLAAACVGLALPTADRLDAAQKLTLWRSLYARHAAAMENTLAM